MKSRIPPLLRAPADAQRVYLTFDDGPDPQWTPRVLDLLAQHAVRATFFVIGRAARDAAGIVQRIGEAGHEVENHSWSHRHPWALSASAARGEVRDGAAAVADLVGRAPRYFRPPHGRLRRSMSEAAQEDGQQIALWSVSAVDWGPFGHAAGIAARLRRVQAGDIVLMHDGKRGINRPEELERVLPGFLQALSERCLEPAPLGALLKG
jgi:peptidoglycan/xylan/chitin deacetylase (PgdA/CDA1 family)